MVETRKKTETKEAPKLMAVIRIRGGVGVTEKIETTMELLRLRRKHRCIIVIANDNYMGMISKVKDYCTFGEVDAATVKDLIEKRGRVVGDNKLTTEYLKQHKLTSETFAKKLVNSEIKIKDVEGMKQFFKLSPPIGGYERGGIKKPYSMHGALGYRGPEINKLLRRMM